MCVYVCFKWFVFITHLSLSRAMYVAETQRGKERERERENKQIELTRETGREK